LIKYSKLGKIYLKKTAKLKYQRYSYNRQLKIELTENAKL